MESRCLCLSFKSSDCKDDTSDSLTTVALLCNHTFYTIEIRKDENENEDKDKDREKYGEIVR